MLQGRLALFLVSDGLLLLSIIVVFLVGPLTRGRTLEAASAQVGPALPAVAE